MRALHKILIAASLALCGGTALAASPVGVADPARIAAAAQTCARHISVYDIDTAAIQAEGWKPFDRKAWPDRNFPAYARIFSRDDGVLIEAAVNWADKSTDCIVLARLAPDESLDDIEHGLSAALGDAPVHKEAAGPRPTTLWAVNRILYLLIPDKTEPDMINISVAPQPIDTPLTTKSDRTGH